MARPIDNDKRRALALEAVTVLEKDGLDLSNAALAARLGLKRPTLLYYFPAKASILEAALEALLTEQAGFVFARVQAAGDHPLDQLAAWLEGVHAFHHGREGRIVFLTQAIASLGVDASARFVEIGDQAFALQRTYIRGQLDAAIAAGRMRACDTDALVRLVRSTVDGLLIQRFMTGCALEPVHTFFRAHVLDPLRIEEAS